MRPTLLALIATATLSGCAAPVYLCAPVREIQGLIACEAHPEIKGKLIVPEEPPAKPDVRT